MAACGQLAPGWEGEAIDPLIVFIECFSNHEAWNVAGWQLSPTRGNERGERTGR